MRIMRIYLFFMFMFMLLGCKPNNEIIRVFRADINDLPADVVAKIKNSVVANFAIGYVPVPAKNLKENLKIIEEFLRFETWWSKESFPKGDGNIQGFGLFSIPKWHIPAEISNSDANWIRTQSLDPIVLNFEDPSFSTASYTLDLIDDKELLAGNVKVVSSELRNEPIYRERAGYISKDIDSIDDRGEATSLPLADWSANDRDLKGTMSYLSIDPIQSGDDIHLLLIQLISIGDIETSIYSGHKSVTEREVYMKPINLDTLTSITYRVE